LKTGIATDISDISNLSKRLDAIDDGRSNGNVHHYHHDYYYDDHDGKGCNQFTGCIPECGYYPEYGRIEDSEVIEEHNKYVESYRQRNARALNIIATAATR
jgi:hypothetical protein